MKKFAEDKSVPFDATPFLPEPMKWDALAKAAKNCEGCNLFRNATQTVFVEGPADAQMMILGETPGDREDQEGHPFVGPAGRLLDQALEHAGLTRREIYVTNVVEHFKWEPSGSRRLHAKPSSRQMAACRPWLEAELAFIRPEIIVCLGATAAQSILGKSFRITKQRGEFFDRGNSKILATYHPAAILRAPSPDDRERMRDEFFHDPKIAAKFAA